jgi:hypothetical protein|tara:strand:+ start:3351 stop:3545 length:195 start_codon:yes stop_codon:yes gene_type:complete
MIFEQSTTTWSIACVASSMLSDKTASVEEAKADSHETEATGEQQGCGFLQDGRLGIGDVYRVFV